MLVDDLLRNLENRKQIELILLDFSKAFDKVNHSKLLYKLNLYGVKGKNVDWIKGFLSNRYQQVVIYGEKSTSIPVTSGVPQGSVLGPILFLVYINDLPGHTKCTTRLFADDTAVYLSFQNISDHRTLQDELNSLEWWEQTWDMAFNPDKCQVIQITHAREPIPTSYTLHGQLLEIVDQAKYLGVDFSSKLSWGPHINHITNKANRTLGYIRHNIKTKNQKIREAAYKTLVRPQLEYASSVWSPHHKDKIHKIETIQCRAARWTINNNDRQCQ